jgi:hypothetical protein
MGDLFQKQTAVELTYRFLYTVTLRVNRYILGTGSVPGNFLKCDKYCLIGFSYQLYEAALL